MSTTLRKCISFAPGGTIDPSPSNTQNLAYESSPGTFANLIFLLDSQTRWVKIWAPTWHMWQDRAAPNPTMLNGMDYQIALAKAYGFGVILTIEQHFPSWVNQSARFTDIPLDTSVNGPWYQMLQGLAIRYSANNPNKPYNNLAQVDILEFCNEPNQIWTTNGNGAGNSDLAGTVAVLFKRAKQISVSIGNAPIIAGPATSDLGPDRVSGRRNYYDFTNDVLNRLQGNGFYDVAPNSVCLWTQHNYTDVTYDQGVGTRATDSPWPGAQFQRNTLRSAWTRALLTNRWKGFPSGDASNPRLILTEGGAQAQVAGPRWGATTPEQFAALQAQLVGRNLVRLSDDTPAGGAGVDMYANYELITVPSYDTGMFEAPPSLAARPLYTDIWKPYPGRL